jgi:hypothetical protein
MQGQMELKIGSILDLIDYNNSFTRNTINPGTFTLKKLYTTPSLA